jgi:hypothetical protein
MSFLAHRREWFMRRTCVGFIVCIWVVAPLLLLQQFSLYQVTWLKVGSVDKLIPVNLQAIYAYLSFSLLLVWAGYGTEDQYFLRFLKSVCLVALVSHLCFFFIPTGLSRDAIDMQNPPLLYKWLFTWEKPRTCLLSLHGSLGTLSCLALWKSGWRSGITSTLWLIATLWSAVSLRQDIFLNLALGIGLAFVSWRFQVSAHRIPFQRLNCSSFIKFIKTLSRFH